MPVRVAAKQIPLLLEQRESAGHDRAETKFSEASSRSENHRELADSYAA